MLKQVFIGLTLFVNLSLLEAKQAIILVHGAFTAKNTWMQPNSKFYKTLQKTSNSLAHIESFYWDQPFEGIFAFEKINAGKKLADLVIKLRNTGYNHIEVYAHSYGGHVVAIASQLLSSENGKLEIIIQKEKTNKTHTSLEASDEYQEAHKLFQDAKKEIQKHLLKTPRITRQTNNPYFINMVHTLAMPNHEITFNVDMNSIEYLINGWSRGTIAQHILGSFKLLTDHARSTNLEYIFPEKLHDDQGWIDFIIDTITDFFLSGFGAPHNPNNLKIVSKILGKWLPVIPFALKTEQINNFEHFSFEKDGILEFSLDQHQPPNYRLETK